MSNSFSEIFRPKTPKQLIGESQISIANALLKRIEDKEILQEILFTGPSGVGKTTIAKMYIQALLGDEVDIDSSIMEMNCSSETGIDYIRIIKDEMQYLPMSLNYRVFYLDEIHGLSKQAQNALLKVIEPVPQHVIFIASTTESNKIIDTLRSRFTEYNLQIPSVHEFRKLSYWITKALNKNGTDFSIPDETVQEIITLSMGNVRTFERYIQQVIDGSYRPIISLDEEGSLIHEIMNKTPNLSKWFQIANSEKLYTSLAINMCRYCIVVLSNPSSNTVKIRKAKELLRIFGSGLSYNFDDKSSFYQKLILLEEALK